MGFERRDEPLLPRRKFLGRVARGFLAASSIVAVFLALGMVGYHWIAGLPWIDSFLNASMILTGMGPVDRLDSTPAKLFAGSYALVSVLVVLAVTGIVLAPLLHRLLHRFHLESDEDDASPS